MKNGKKGFLFVITIFLILTYMMLSISVWVKALEASERTYSELYKESTVELVIEQLTPAKLAEISDMIMNRAVFKVNDLAKEHPLKEGPVDDEFRYAENAVHEYLVSGAISGENFQDAYEPEPEGNASLGGWATTLNASLQAIGVYVEDFRIYDFTFAQEDYKTLNYSFKVDLSITDNSRTTSLTRTYDLSGRVLVTGLVDPAIARESGDAGETIYRQFFFYEEGDGYLNKANLAPDRLAGITAGQGWFYGPVVRATEAGSIDDDLKRRYIVAGTYSEITSIGGRSELEEFGAFIVTSPIMHRDPGSPCEATHPDEYDTFMAIDYEGTACTANLQHDTEVLRPFVVAPAFDVSDAPLCMDLLENATTRCALIIASHDPLDVYAHVERKLETPAESTGVFGMEELRDYTMCGYYTLEEYAPSYLQRLLPDPYTRSGGEAGIETFVIGEYADPALYERMDRIDRKMLEGVIRNEFIRGMPGCREYGSCSNDETPTGRFGLNDTSIGDYGLGAIDCGAGAECGG